MSQKMFYIKSPSIGRWSCYRFIWTMIVAKVTAHLNNATQVDRVAILLPFVAIRKSFAFSHIVMTLFCSIIFLLSIFIFSLSVCQNKQNKTNFVFVILLTTFDFGFNLKRRKNKLRLSLALHISIYLYFITISGKPHIGLLCAMLIII